MVADPPGPGEETPEPGEDGELAAHTAGPSAGHPRRGRALRRLLAVLLVVAAMAVSFYGGVLSEFHFGPTLNGWLPSSLLLTRPGKGFDAGTLQQIYSIMLREYARTDINPDDAFNGAARGMTQLYLDGKFGDGFSTYYTPEELKQNQDFLQGQFGGIGVTIGLQNGKLTITKVLPDTPAQKSGLAVNDVVTKIDGKSTDGISEETARTRIKGPVGTHVKLTVSRGGKSLDFDITRANINVPSVVAKDLGSGVLYVRIFDFGQHTGTDFENALQQGFSRGASKIILDLRQNPGGYVAPAGDVVSEFVQSGTVVVTQSRGGKKDEQKVTGRGVAFSQKLVVLVDGNTASAAEIVAGSLLDNHRTILVGVKTFGKGLVEDDFPLRNGGDLHLTVAYWYRPNGQSIDKNGITPDKVVALDKPENFYQVESAGSDPAKDPQLQAGLAALK